MDVIPLGLVGCPLCLVTARVTELSGLRLVSRVGFSKLLLLDLSEVRGPGLESGPCCHPFSVFFLNGGFSHHLVTWLLVEGEFPSNL